MEAKQILTNEQLLYQHLSPRQHTLMADEIEMLQDGMFTTKAYLQENPGAQAVMDASNAHLAEHPDKVQIRFVGSEGAARKGEQQLAWALSTLTNENVQKAMEQQGKELRFLFLTTGIGILAASYLGIVDLSEFPNYTPEQYNHVHETMLRLIGGAVAQEAMAVATNSKKKTIIQVEAAVTPTVLAGLSAYDPYTLVNTTNMRAQDEAGLRRVALRNLQQALIAAEGTTRATRSPDQNKYIDDLRAEVKRVFQATNTTLGEKNKRISDKRVKEMQLMSPPNQIVRRRDQTNHSMLAWIKSEGVREFENVTLKDLQTKQEVREEIQKRYYECLLRKFGFSKAYVGKTSYYNGEKDDHLDLIDQMTPNLKEILVLLGIEDEFIEEV